MTEPLPYGNFEWFNPSNITNDSIQDYSNESEGCYILEVDLKYPKELHNPDEETSFRLATDANNLHGKAMAEALPYGNFEWFNPSNITNDFIKDSDNDG